MIVLGMFICPADTLVILGSTFMSTKGVIMIMVVTTIIMESALLFMVTLVVIPVSTLAKWSRVC